MTYARAGVDIERGDAFVEGIQKLTRHQERRGIVAGIGGFGALFDPRALGYKNPLIVSSTDGIGTKLKLAQHLGVLDTLGIDLVAMCVNDILTLGARPVFFLDYLATAKLKPAEALTIMRGVVAGCDQAGCPLIGGETAEMPGLYRAGDFDLAGFAIGLVEKGAVVDGSKVVPGDLIVGLPSSGCHSNGYSLVRAILARAGLLRRPRPQDRPFLRWLLNPTVIYVKPILAVLKKVEIKAMAHITGGGLPGNLTRAFPRGLGAEVYPSAIPPQPGFERLVSLGRLSECERWRVFNGGVGYALVVAEREIKSLFALLQRQGLSPFLFGRVKKMGRDPEVLFKR